MTQLYAKIKQSSEYRNQNSYHMVDGKFVPFKVKYDDKLRRFVGGVGGNYAIDDLKLYVKQDSKFVRVGI